MLDICFSQDFWNQFFKPLMKGLMYINGNIKASGYVLVPDHPSLSVYLIHNYRASDEGAANATNEGKETGTRQTVITNDGIRMTNGIN